MSDEEKFVHVSNVIKTYKGGVIRALDNISLSIDKGEIFGLIGPNGAGKTTLIGCLLGLLTPDSGRITIGGKSADCMSVRKITGYVPERPDFEYWMTARQFLLYHHGLSGQDSRRAQADIDETLELVELPKQAWNRRLKTYSRGMLQRLNLAQLVIGKPQIMLLDEPTLGLDPTGVAVVRKIVNNMRDASVTAIINSHQLDEVERLCDRVAFIRQGKIASIETMSGSEVSDYILSVRWVNNTHNGTLQAAIADAAAAAHADVTEQHERWGRFAVKDKHGAAALIRELIAVGLPVEEAVPERSRLEQLFLNGAAGECYE